MHGDAQEPQAGAQGALWTGHEGWPAPDVRPSQATVAAVLGFVAGGLAAFVVLYLVLLIATGAPVGVLSVLVLLGLPCAVALIRGGIRLLRDRLVQPLQAAALWSIVSLLLVLLMGGMFGGGPGLVLTGLFLTVSLPLPVLTAFFARHPAVTAWAYDG